jgi:alpha-tubulin suppressor-like RCC1 family protein
MTRNAVRFVLYAVRYALYAVRKAQSAELTAARVLALSLLLASCYEPFTPRIGVPTLDDEGTDDFIAVSAGREHTCALVTDGTAYCWGSNEFGQLGIVNDTTTCRRDDRPIPCRRQPVAVAGGLKFQKIRAGGLHTCALTLDSHIYCWGDNVHGALGVPGVAQSSAPVQVLSTALFTDLAAGGSHSCGLRTDGVLFCWGANESGQLGINSSGNGSAVPVSASTAQRFASVAAGDNRTCARIANGTSYCWGVTFILQGASEITRLQLQPLRVAQDTLFESLTVGSRTTCGITLDNRAFCWESNFTGAMGDGSQGGSSIPVGVATSLHFVAISSGATQTCGIAADGLAHCWGGGSLGQLGVSPSALSTRCGDSPASLIPCSRIPLQVAGWRVFSQISAGLGNHVCALTLTGNIYCWGAGGLGQRGDGRTTTAEWSPVKTRSI